VKGTASPFAAVNGDIRMAAARGLHTISAYAAGTPAPGGTDRLLGQLLCQSQIRLRIRAL